MTDFDKINTSSFLRRLLIEPEYRMLRHASFIFILAVISLNQTFITMKEYVEILGPKIFLQFLFLFVTYIIVCYFNLFILLPKFLLKKQYIKYSFYLILITGMLTIFQTLEERAMLASINRVNVFYTPPMIYINTLSAFALVILCISGGGMTIVLKEWMINDQKVRQLEKLHIQSEVEQLKEQVNPHLLFNILNRTGGLAKYRSQEASDMLIRLSQLLRYQLYDCNREKVLLSAEIKFLNDYLTLEKMYSGSFDFTIQSEKSCSLILVSPLLFISFVQSAVIRIYELNKKSSIHVRFKSDDDYVLFTCTSDLENIFAHVDFSKIGKRLELLYKRHYSLTITGNEVTLILDI